MAGDRACEIMPRRNAMKRRTMMLTFGVLGVGLLAGVAGMAFAHHGGREAMMKHFVSSAIDDALAPAQPTPEQRAAIYAARDRAFAVVEEHRKGRRARMEEALALFEAEPADPARLQAFRERAAGEHERVREAISQAIVEAHDVLTPAQRKAVADHVRSHHGRHMP
jgi:periplasmic protein CpxP/Spy